MKYVAKLNEFGLYDLKTIKEIMSSTCFQMEGKQVFSKLVKLQNGEEEILDPRKDSFKEFENLDECMEFIYQANKN